MSDKARQRRPVQGGVARKNKAYKNLYEKINKQKLLDKLTMANGLDKPFLFDFFLERCYY